MTHGRDSIYRLTSLQDVAAATNIATFTWQGVGRLATTSNQNGTSTAYTWDGFARIQKIDHQLPTAQTFHKFEYAYDKVHNRRMEKNTFDAAWIATLPAQVQTFLNGRNTKGDVYAYDWAYRLVDARYDVTNPLQEVQNPGSQPFVKNVAYTLDGLGNRSQVLTTPPTPPSTVTYAADVVNQYTAVGGDREDPRQQREPQGRRDLRLRLRLREPARPGPPVRHPDPDRRLPLRRART